MTIIGTVSAGDMYEYRRGTINGLERVCYLYRGMDTDTLTWKWMAKGTHIPFPVRSGTWFAGFNPITMDKWMRDNGWMLHTRIVMP